MFIHVGISARHVHLNKEDLNILFGEGHELCKMKDLSQPMQFACHEQVTIKANNNEIKDVRILGPLRDYTQVEISKTDAYFLKINPPVRDSGDLDGASSITIVGPRGEVTKECCIIPTRHIHATREDLIKNNLINVTKVSLKVSGIKGGILDNVFIKESPDYYFEVHLDIDDANAHLIEQGQSLEVVGEEYE